MLDASFQGVQRLFVFILDDTVNGNKNFERDSHEIYFLPEVNITNYNKLIDGRNFHDYRIGNQIKRMIKLEKLQ